MYSLEDRAYLLSLHVTEFLVPTQLTA